MSRPTLKQTECHKTWFVNKDFTDKQVESFEGDEWLKIEMITNLLKDC